MSLTDGNGSLSPADIAAVTCNNGNCNNGFGFGGDGAWWFILLIILFAGIGNGWNGNGFGAGNAGYVGQDVQRGFDQSAVMNGITGINNSLANAEVSRCNQQANILQTLNANQNANTANMNQLAMSLQNACCENRAATADLKYTIANESALTRQNGDANNQKILDKLCQLEMDNMRQNYENRIGSMQTTIYSMQTTIDDLRSSLAAANGAASRNAQTAQILADNAAQTVALEQHLNPTAKPAYIVQNPNCCVQNTCGCGF